MTDDQYRQGRKEASPQLNSLELEAALQAVKELHSNHDEIFALEMFTGLPLRDVVSEIFFYGIREMLSMKEFAENRDSMTLRRRTE